MDSLQFWSTIPKDITLKVLEMIHYDSFVYVKDELAVAQVWILLIGQVWDIHNAESNRRL